LIGSALAERRSKASYLHGSFGSGKSHFMAVLRALLDGDVGARSVPSWLTWSLAITGSPPPDSCWCPTTSSAPRDTNAARL
jgi:hypothetical protein